MALWGFSRESNQVASGANTVAGILKGYRPLPQSSGIGHSYDQDAGGSYANKRNVIATTKGWVRRVNRTKTEAPTVNVQFDEVLVAAAPGGGFYYTSNNYLGNADIVEIYVKLNANGVISANATSSNLYVVFNSPVHKRPSGNLMSISIANTVGGNNAVARIAVATAARANVANNVMVFTMPKLQGGSGSARATYHINAQSISVTGGGNPLYNPEIGITAAANLVITGAVANNLSRFNGIRITNFQVSPKGV